MLSAPCSAPFKKRLVSLKSVLHYIAANTVFTPLGTFEVRTGPKELPSAIINQIHLLLHLIFWHAALTRPIETQIGVMA